MHDEVTSISLTPTEQAICGRVTLPGSKSITNRALLIAALSQGSSYLSGALKSADTHFMAQALHQLGVAVEEPDDSSFIVHSNGTLLAPDTELMLGNAGTATRFLTAAASLVNGKVIIDGDSYMRKRPIAPLVEALQAVGVDIKTPTGCPPVTIISNGSWSKQQLTIDASLSSQYVSALLMTAACQPQTIDVYLSSGNIGARGYIDLTLAVMRAFGGIVDMIADNHYRVQPGAYQARDFAIEPDASAATYFWAMEKLSQGNIDIGLAASEFTQPDAASWAIMQRFPDLPTVINGSQMQDAVPTLAVLAAFANGDIRFTDIANLRVKECDRISAVASGLNVIKPGLASVENDDLIVHGDPDLAHNSRPALIDSHDDHRIAMSFAIAGLKVPGLKISNPDCVSKTFPEFWHAIDSLRK